MFNGKREIDIFLNVGDFIEFILFGRELNYLLGLKVKFISFGCGFVGKDKKGFCSEEFVFLLGRGGRGY